MDSGRTIERLRDAARALRSFDDRAALRAIQAAQDALDAAKADRLAALGESKEFELDGASTIATWARNELRLDAGRTKALVHAAATAKRLPEVGMAAAEGRIRLDHVAVFSYGLKHIGATVVGESEGWLLDVATTHEPAALRQVMRSLREAVYPDELDEAWAKGMDKQDIQVNPVPDGWHVNGFLNTSTGAKFKQVLDTLGAPRDADDQRPGSERRIDAFDRMVTQVLEAGLPSDKGIRPQLSVIVDTHGPSARLAGFGSIGPKLLDYLTCLSDLTPIVTTGGELEQARILSVGRTRRHANRRQRRAIIAKQGGECATPRLPQHPPGDPPRHLVVSRRPYRPRRHGRPVCPLPPPGPPPAPQHRARRPWPVRLHHQDRATRRARDAITRRPPPPRPSPTTGSTYTATDVSRDVATSATPRDATGLRPPQQPISPRAIPSTCHRACPCTPCPARATCG